MSAFLIKEFPKLRSQTTGTISVKETSITYCILFLKSQIDVKYFLLYNLVMKKIIGIFITFGLFANLTLASDLDSQIRVLYAENNIKEAFNLLLSIPEEDRSSENWILLGNILQDEGKTDEAIFMYNSAISKVPKDYKAHYNLGNMYLAQNKPNLAIEEFKKTVKYNPEFSYGYYNLGCAYLKIEKPRKAKWEFFKAIDLNNQEADFYYNIAYTYKILGNDKQAKIYLEYYDKLMEQKH